MARDTDLRTYDMAQRIFHEEIDHEVWFVELLIKKRDGESPP